MAGATALSQLSGVIKLAIIGDVHYDWDPALDAAALKLLNPDAAIFVGDYGEEAVSIVQQIAGLDTPKAVMLGNHDAWGALYYRDKLDKVQEQIKALGPSYIGYGSKQFTAADGQGFSVVGARPFSDGNSSIDRAVKELYQLDAMEESADKITSTALAAPQSGPLVLVGHNGPAGLGQQRHDICGRDFTKKPADYGDRDMQLALEQIHARGRKVPLVTFGHMHGQLFQRYGAGQRNMVHIDASTGTVFVNSAIVPRHKVHKSVKRSHFLTVTIEHGLVTGVNEVWIADADEPSIVETKPWVMSHVYQPGKLNWTYWKEHEQAWGSNVVFPIDEKLSFISHEEL